MGSITVRQIDDVVKERLKKRAEKNGVSMEAEVRSILCEAVKPRSAREVIEEALGPDWEGIDFEIPRIPDRPSQDFD